MPGKNSQCQGHNIYSYSHPCLPFLYRYQNILSTHNFEWMRLTLATPAKGFFCFYILPIEGSEHQHTRFISPVSFSAFKTGGCDNGYNKQTAGHESSHFSKSNRNTYNKILHQDQTSEYHSLDNMNLYRTVCPTLGQTFHPTCDLFSHSKLCDICWDL